MAGTAVKAVVKTVDMSDEMEKDAIDIASYAVNEFVVESIMANHIKKEFDKKYRCEAERERRTFAAGSRAGLTYRDAHRRQCSG